MLHTCEDEEDAGLAIVYGSRRAEFIGCCCICNIHLLLHGFGAAHVPYELVERFR